MKVLEPIRKEAKAGKHSLRSLDYSSVKVDVEYTFVLISYDHIS